MICGMRWCIGQVRPSFLPPELLSCSKLETNALSWLWNMRRGRRRVLECKVVDLSRQPSSARPALPLALTRRLAPTRQSTRGRSRSLRTYRRGRRGAVEESRMGRGEGADRVVPRAREEVVRQGRVGKVKGSHGIQACRTNTVPPNERRRFTKEAQL